MASDHPVEIHIDNSGRLHHASKQAFSYSDGWGLNSWHGVRLPDDVFTQSISIEKINSEQNAELKRCYMEMYGFDKYLTDSGAKPIKKDEFGELFKLPGTQLPIVRVINSSPEPDGTFKNYVLTALKADVKTPHAAVASTFGLPPDKYQPVAQS